jgi:hypothetical protein
MTKAIEIRANDRTFEFSNMFWAIDMLKHYRKEKIPANLLVKDHKVKIEFDPDGTPTVANVAELPPDVMQIIQSDMTRPIGGKA